MTRDLSDARTVAARVIERVRADDAYLAAALDAELGRSRLPPKERGLCTEIAYGVVRTEGALVERVTSFTSRPIKAKDAFLWSHVLVAAYQILLLDRVPAHAAVDAAVRAVRQKRGPKVGGFVNALCRKLADTPRLDRQRAIERSFPAWLVAELVESVGRDEALALLGARTAPAPSGSVRVVGAGPLAKWLEEADRGRASPRARRVARLGDLRRLEGYAEGRFVIQEEGAQVVALALGARPGERVLDACAGRGQKTTLLVEQVSALTKAEPCNVVAADLHPRKLEAIGPELARLGLPPVDVHTVDLAVGVGTLPDDFDRVLVDAPCTGTGTLGRRPEIARRLASDDPARLGAVQEAILRHAASRARVGGRVVYAVCSVLPAEGEAVVGRVADVLEPTPFDAVEARALFGSAASGRLLPLAHGTDGYFVASLVRRG